MAAFSVSFLKKIFDRTFKTSGQVLKPFSEPEWVPKDPDFALDDYPDSLRLLAIRESLHGHKSVIFDSQRTQRFSAPFPDSIDNYDYVQDDIAYKVIRNPNPGYQEEIKTLAECMLGTIPLSGQIEALKVHYISQSSVLWSLTFQLEMTSTCPSNRSSEKSFGSRIGGSAQDFFLEGDSGFFSPSMNNLSFNDSSSDLSLKRRWQQLTTTSMASLSGRSESLLQIPTQESQSRKIKISVGLLITLPEKLQVKLNESNVFLEELLQRLKIGIGKNIALSRNLSIMARHISFYKIDLHFDLSTICKQIVRIVKVTCAKLNTFRILCSFLIKLILQACLPIFVSKVDPSMHLYIRCIYCIVRPKRS